MSNDPPVQNIEGAISYKDKLMNLFGEDVHQNLSKSILKEFAALASQNLEQELKFLLLMRNGSSGQRQGEGH